MIFADLPDDLDKINHIASGLQDVTIMEICGGHTNVIMKYGIRDMLPKNIRLISGPGCPVCVSSQYDIDCMIAIADAGIPIATYGDMLDVPGNSMTLEDTRARGGRVFEVYSASEVLRLKEKHPDIVFFGIGFETTAPMTAYLLAKDVCVYSVHKLIPPAIRVLIKDARIDGFIDPGHVSTIIGADAYKDIKIPQVVAGFAPHKILDAVRFLLELIRDRKDIVINRYPEAVSDNGNIKAKKIMAENFMIKDSEWRGLGTIKDSGLEVKDDNLNAKLKYGHIIKKVKRSGKTPCRCQDVLRGIIEPSECALYRKTCTPQDPKGACMVSAEGACSIAYRYGR